MSKLDKFIELSQRGWAGFVTLLGFLWRLFWRLAALFALSSAMLVFAYRFIDPPSTPLILYYRLELGKVDWRWTPLERISPAARQAVVAAEDGNFCTHYGFDFDAIRYAYRDWKRGAPLRGASTISQQTAKNLFLWPGRSFVRKGAEIWFTGLVELLLPKKRILELYLNIAEFGRGVFGIEAASRRAYRVPARQLQLGMAARLATVLPAPRRRDARRLSKAQTIRAERTIRNAQTLRARRKDLCFLR
ncbi:MAG: monofunctional biosynthetic peptidoglycan transglycosylase [Neomegalonema sp.]|nr:monofunctional biosynthetic peptidoglycan transglycosylase [Neomegalonema sp.]